MNEQEQKSGTPWNHKPPNFLHKANYGTRHRFPPPSLPTSNKRQNTQPSPYSSNLHPKLSPLRPHVLARERLRLWTPVNTRNNLDSNGNSTKLGAEDLERIAALLEGSWENSTLESYGSGLLVFHVFCDDNDIPEEQRAPTSPILAASFVATMAGAYSGKTIRNYFYGVRAWHILHGVKWEMNVPEMDGLLKGAEKVTPATSKRKQRTPYTPDFISKI